MVAGLLLGISIHGWAADTQDLQAAVVKHEPPEDASAPDETATAEPTAEPAAPEPNPIPFKYEHGGMGVCIGKGAGLLGLYGYVRPADHFALEAAIGKRILLFVISDGSTTSDLEVYWPLAGALKAQYFFSGRERRFQPGIEIGAMGAEDMGLGGEVSGVMRLRLGSSLSLDANLGVGFFPDSKNKNIDYLMRVRGRTRTYYENNTEILTPPVMLMWGVGISYIF
jgi:hypothetical protein